MVRRKLVIGCCVFALIFGLLATPVTSQAEENNGFAYLGSGLFSLLYFPIKLTACVGTQAVGAVAYVATYNVPGNFDGGTNGKDIGEIASSACAVPWFISADQVKEDY